MSNNLPSQYSYLDVGYDNLLNRGSLLDGADIALADGSSVSSGTSLGNGVESGSVSEGATTGETVVSDPVTNLVEDQIALEDIASGEMNQSWTIGEYGSIAGGATNYNEGEGWWLGYRIATDDYGFFIGNSTGNKLTYNTTDDVLTISGTISASGGAIGGWSINATSIFTGTEDHSGYTTNAGDITLYSDGTNSSIHANKWYIDINGVLNCTAAVISGGVTTTAGSSVDGQYLTVSSVTASKISVTSLSAINADLGTITAGTITGATFQTSALGTTGIKFDSTSLRGYDGSTNIKFELSPTTGTLTVSSIVLTGLQAGSAINGSYLDSASVSSAATNIALQGWTQTSVFSVTDLDTVAWSSGTLTTSAGTAYSIDAGNTGNMAARTYIYLDIAVSTTAYQVTTTASTAIGNGKILIGTAINGVTEPTFEIFSGVGGLNINASQIVAGSITANEIAASTITADRLTVSQLSGISADLGTITAGTITLPSGGHIKSGQTAYNTGIGFFVGNVGAVPVLSIGDGGVSQYFVYNGSTCILNNSDLSFQDIFGDGSDGDVSLTADTTITRDMFYDDLTIPETYSDSLVVYTTTTNGDMYARRGGNEDFATKRAGVGTSESETGTTINLTLTSTSTPDVYSALTRAYLEFDTSSIPDDATIDSATLQLYVDSKNDNFSQSISIVKCLSDFSGGDAANYNIDNYDVTKQATDVAISAISTTAYNTWTLNSTGRGNISKTGDTRLGVFFSCDADNSAPTWSSNVTADILFQTAEGTNKPKLTVNYTYPVELDTSGFRVFVKGTLTVNGIMQRNGNNGGNGASTSTATGGAGGTAATTLTSGSVYGCPTPVAGGTGGNATTATPTPPAANAIAKGLGVNGSNGGQGGDSGGSPTLGATGATITGTVYNTPKNSASAYFLYDIFPSADYFKSSAGSGGGGGGGGSGSGGSGGAGGGAPGGGAGIISIFAKKIVIGASGIISANGGNGGNGGNSSNATPGLEGGGGGGGAGGPSGVILLTYSSFTNSGSITVSGGTKGLKGTGYVGGAQPTDGTDGLTGNIIQLQV